MIVKTRVLPFLLGIPCFLPAVWRLASKGLSEPVGLSSDLGLGCALLALLLLGPHWLRALLLLFWALFQAMSAELFAAVGRFPSWQDVHYLLDPDFVGSSTAGLHLAEPLYVLLLFCSAVPAALLPLSRPGWRPVAAAVVVGLGLLLQANYGASHANQSVVARYNPLHWFVADALFRHRASSSVPADMAELPESLRTLDLSGESLLGEKRAKNVLLVVLEGISGIYYPEIREKMNVPEGPFQMLHLAEATGDAMLIPDFISHSHQTIRGLYAIHCGDMSKLSYDTPKGMELQLNPQRGEECLPARLAQNGWQTHYLQGAPLQFMNKDSVMPAMGFQEVHGLEWFSKRKEKDFVWGTTDPDFFAGAADYVRRLQQSDKPWLLSLLTVATHQPFDAPEELVQKYGSRKIAAVARLDETVAQFLAGLRRDGILDNTLVIVTSDESHGYEGADWYSSWGFSAVLAPGEKHLPRFKEGTFGLMDMEASILDYLQVPQPSSIIGRSIFRDYGTPREMASYTSGKVRWQTTDDRLFECSVDGVCHVSKPAGILRPNRAASTPDAGDGATRIFRLAALLDNKLTAGMKTQLLQFGHGEIRQLPEKIRNEWSDNLVGAQYLDFPENSRVDVDIRIKAVTAEESGVRLRLVMRQFEHEVGGIERPEFPLLRQGEECRVQFGFDNPEARKSFSFHLVGEGHDSSIQLQKFEVAINRGE